MGDRGTLHGTPISSVLAIACHPVHDAYFIYEDVVGIDLFRLSFP